MHRRSIPSITTPLFDNNPDLAKQRQKTVVEAMVENGKLSEEDADKILSQ